VVVGALGLLGLAVLLTPPPPSPPDPVVPAQEPLTWQPPPCGDATHRCIDLYLSDTGENQYLVLESDHDYRVHLP